MSRFGFFEQYLDDSGNPLIAGKLYFYEPGTTTKKNTYSDVSQTTLNANPIILGASGRQPDIFFTGSAKCVLTDENDVQIEVRDPISGDSLSAAEVMNLYESNLDRNAYTDDEKSKLAGIEEDATKDQTDAEIETAYNNQVDQVSSGEKTAGSETAIRRFSPLDVAEMAATHGGGGGGGGSGINWTTKSAPYTAAVNDGVVFSGFTTGDALTLPGSFALGDEPIVVVNAEAGSTDYVAITPAAGDDLYIGEAVFDASSGAFNLRPGESVMLVPRTANASWYIVPLYVGGDLRGLIDLGTVTSNQNLDVGESSAYFVTIGDDGITLDINTAEAHGNGNYRKKGTCYVYLDAARSGLSVTSDVGSAIIQGSAPTASGEMAVLVWEYVRVGSTEYLWAEWVSEA